MKTRWSHLPNAKYIDLVLESVKANPEAWDAVRNAARNAAWNAVRDAVRNAAWNAARDAARDAAWDAAYDAAWHTILALIAFDDCAHMLDSEPDELRVLSRLGVDAATLMIPAAIAFKSIREKELVVL